MAVSKKYRRFDQYLLSGKLRYNGFERWRYVFTGNNKFTGEERSFFIEIYLTNPLVSPKNVIIAQKSRPILSAEDLEYALAGTISAQSVTQQTVLKPSYTLIKCGMYGENGKQFNRFIPSSEFVWNKKELCFRGADCSFGEDLLAGSVEISAKEISENPEYFCSSGKMSWNLHYERMIAAGPFTQKKNFWCPSGSKTIFAGTVSLDGTEYTINSKTSFGYVDKSWGDKLCNPYFHISSSNFTSIITGKQLSRSSFALEGEYEEELKFHVFLEDEEFVFNPKKDKQFFECIQSPSDEDGDKLHWTFSITGKKNVIDIDVFCKTKDMYVRDFEIPEGNRTMLKILSGGNGTGEIRIYKKNKQDLELLEHAHLANSLCEYGKTEETAS